VTDSKIFSLANMKTTVNYETDVMGKETFLEDILRLFFA
jgi:hypothetical protein